MSLIFNISIYNSFRIFHQVGGSNHLLVGGRLSCFFKIFFQYNMIIVINIFTHMAFSEFWIHQLEDVSRSGMNKSRKRTFYDS